MTCDEFVCALCASGDPDPLALSHARECVACGALLSSGPAVYCPPNLTARVRAQLLRDLKPVRPLPGNGALSAGLLIVLAVAVGAGAAVLGPHGHKELDGVSRWLLYSSLAAAALGCSISLPRQVIPGARISKGHWMAFAALAVFAAVVLARFGTVELESPFRAGAVCLALGSVWGSATAAGIWGVLRRGVWHGASATALAGLTGGLGGLAGLTLHCPVLDIWHVLFWHSSAVLIVTGAGALTGARLWFSKTP
jgi:Negative regulator of sigma F